MSSLQVFLMGDQPFCCPYCGARTEFEDDPLNPGVQHHKCLRCKHEFLVEEETFELTSAQRERISSALMEDMLDSALQSDSYLYDIIKNGHKGLKHYTDTELVQEYRMVFDDDPLEDDDEEEDS